MEYKTNENQGIGYKAMEYLSHIKDAAKKTAVVGLAGLVMTLGAAGCARTSGGRITLGEMEWGDKTVMSRDKDIQKTVIESDAKYEDKVNVVPGKGLGINYK